MEQNLFQGLTDTNCFLKWKDPIWCAVVETISFLAGLAWSAGAIWCCASIDQSHFSVVSLSFSYGHHWSTVTAVPEAWKTRTAFRSCKNHQQQVSNHLITRNATSLKSDNTHQGINKTYLGEWKIFQTAGDVYWADTCALSSRRFYMLSAYDLVSPRSLILKSSRSSLLEKYGDSFCMPQHQIGSLVSHHCCLSLLQSHYFHLQTFDLQEGLIKAGVDIGEIDDEMSG